MADLAKLVVKLEAQTAQYQKKLETSDRRLKRFEKNTKRSLSKVATSFKTILGGVAIASATRGIIRYSDEYTNLSNRLRLATNSAEDFARAQASVFQIAQDTRQSLGATGELYQRLALSTKELGLNQKDLSGIVTTVNQSLVISGASAQAAEAAIVQLGQGLAAGALRGEEFNSVAEQAPRLLQVLSDSLGLNIGQLRELAKEGGLTAEVFINALKGQSDVIAAEFASTSTTVQQSLQKIDNALINAVGGEGQEATKNLTGALDDFAELVSDPLIVQGIGDIAGAVINLTGLFVKLAAAIPNAGRALGEFFARGTAGTANVKDAIDDLAALQRLGANLSNPNIRARFERNDNLIRSFLGFASVDELKQYGSQIESEIQSTLQRISRLQERGQTGESVEPFLQQFAQIQSAIEAEISSRKRLAEVRSPSTGAAGGSGSGTPPADTSIQDAFLESLRQEQEYFEQLGATLTNSVLTPQEEYKGLVLELDSALSHSAISQETYNRKLAEYREELAQATPGIQSMAELNEALNDTLPPQEAALNSIREQITLLVEAMGQFPAKADAIGLAIQNLRAEEQDLIEQTKETGEEMSEFAKQAARNIQDQLGETIKDTLQGDFDGILASWGDMLAEMGSQAIAARLAKSFGLEEILSGGGDSGGGIGDFFGGFFADGGRPHPGKVSVVGEQGPELFIPDGVSGQIMPNGASSGSSVSVGQMVFPGVTNEREAKRASGTMRRELAKLLDESRRY